MQKQYLRMQQQLSPSVVVCWNQPEKYNSQDGDVKHVLVLVLIIFCESANSNPFYYHCNIDIEVVGQKYCNIWFCQPVQAFTKYLREDFKVLKCVHCTESFQTARSKLMMLQPVWCLFKCLFKTSLLFINQLPLLHDKSSLLVTRRQYLL